MPSARVSRSHGRIQGAKKRDVIVALAELIARIHESSGDQLSQDPIPIYLCHLRNLRRPLWVRRPASSLTPQCCNAGWRHRLADWRPNVHM
jgi:hypothetical protein